MKIKLSKLKSLVTQTLGEFGADMDEFNQTLNDIMYYYKSNQVKENKIYRFKYL